MAKKILAVTGPTASGKSACAVEIARRLNGEIVSCDSMQLYRGMDIGTAKPGPEEMGGVRHHLLSVLAPDAGCSASEYRDLALRAIGDILARGKTPVLCGGTGLYLDALTRPFRFAEKSDAELRLSLRARAEREGCAALHRELWAIDPIYAARIHENDLRRVVRALEIFRLTGKTPTETAREDGAGEPDFIGVLVAPLWSRERLYERIDRRVDDMLEAGLLREARALLKAGLDVNSTAGQAIGYKELFFVPEGDAAALDRAAQRIKQATRRYAKRQNTWLRRDGRVHFVVAEGKSAEEIAEEMIRIWRDETA